MRRLGLACACYSDSDTPRCLPSLEITVLNLGVTSLVLSHCVEPVISASRRNAYRNLQETEIVRWQ